MSQRIKFYGMVITLLLAAAVVAGCVQGSSASEITAEEPAAAPADEQDEGAESPETAADVPADVMEAPESVAEAVVQMTSAFNAASGELPEGITMDNSGNTYVSVGYPFWFPAGESFGEIWKIGPGGDKTVLHAFPGGPGPAGLAVSPSGDLFIAYPNPMDPDTNGVYRLTGDRDPVRLAGSEHIGLANGLALTKYGNLFVSDSALGAVWRIPRGGGEAEIWVRHDLLAGCDPENYSVGANGVALWKNILYVANTSRGLLARVPILRDGTAGAPQIVAGDEECDAESDELYGMDGIALDVHGNVFALLVIQHKLVRIDPDDGSYSVLLTEDDGLFNPASITFGTGKSNRKKVFISNFALLPPEPAASLGPGILAYDVGVPGLPIP